MESPYEMLGEDGVRSLVAQFYKEMGTRPEAATIFAMHADDLGPIEDKLATFLIGWMGGPQRYNERFGRVVIPVAHRRFDIGTPERDAWLACMAAALDTTTLPPAMVERLMSSFATMADMCRTQP